METKNELDEFVETKDEIVETNYEFLESMEQSPSIADMDLFDKCLGLDTFTDSAVQEIQQLAGFNQKHQQILDFRKVEQERRARKTKAAQEAEELECQLNILEFKQEKKELEEKEENWQSDHMNSHVEINVNFEFARVFRLIGQKMNLDDPVCLGETRMEAIAKHWHQRSKYRFSRVAFEHSTQYEAKHRYVFSAQLTDYTLSKFESYISTSSTSVKPWTLADEIASRKSEGRPFLFQELVIIAFGLIDICWSWYEMRFQHFHLSPTDIELTDITNVSTDPFWKRMQDRNIIIDKKHGRVFATKWIDSTSRHGLWTKQSIIPRQNLDEYARDMLEWQHCEWKKPRPFKFDQTIDKKWQDDLTSVGLCLIQMATLDPLFAGGSTRNSDKERDTTQFDQDHKTAAAYLDKIERELNLIKKNDEWNFKVASLIIGLLHNYGAFLSSPHHILGWLLENCFHSKKGEKGDDEWFSQHSAEDRRDKRQESCFYKMAVRRKAVTVITIFGLAPEQATYDFLNTLFEPFAIKEEGGYTRFRIENYDAEIGSAMISFEGEDQEERAHRAFNALAGTLENTTFFIEDNVCLPSRYF